MLVDYSFGDIVSLSNSALIIHLILSLFSGMIYFLPTGIQLAEISTIPQSVISEAKKLAHKISEEKKVGYSVWKITLLYFPTSTLCILMTHELYTQKNN